MKLSLHKFFSTTNILLIIFAAGLVGLGVHEFNEAGAIPPVIENVWNINPILSDKSEMGLLLKALIGYNGNPSLTEIVAYTIYLAWYDHTCPAKKANTPSCENPLINKRQSVNQFDLAIGSVNVNTLPFSFPADSTQIRPPCASMRARAIVKPMPLPPPACRERDLSTR